MRMIVYAVPFTGKTVDRRLIFGESVRGIRLQSLILEGPEDLIKIIECTKTEEGIRWLRDVRNALTTKVS